MTEILRKELGTLQRQVKNPFLLSLIPIKSFLARYSIKTIR
jgi:hypothetical protein